MATKQTVYFANLDSIRFFAALMVFVSHGISPSYEFLNFKGSFLEKVILTLSSGGSGVTMFFVLSGFLITYLLLTEKKLGVLSIKNFYIRRVLRIWPLYFAVLLLTFGIYPFLKSLVGVSTHLESNIIYHLFFLSNFDVLNILQNFYGSDAMSQNITWSISVEEQFYAVWPLLIAFVPWRFLPGSILVTALASLGFRLYHHDHNDVLYYHTFSTFLDLAVGAFFAYLTFANEKVKKFLSNASTGWQGLFILSAFTWQLFKNDIMDPEYAEALSRFITSILFALVIVSQSFGKPESRLALGKIRFADRWGKYSYGIYMLHPIILLLLDIAVRSIDLKLDNFSKVFILGLTGFFFTLTASYLSYRFFESRFLKMKDSFTVVATH